MGHTIANFRVFVKVWMIEILQFAPDCRKNSSVQITNKTSLSYYYGLLMVILSNITMNHQPGVSLLVCDASLVHVAPCS